MKDKKDMNKTTIVATSVFVMTILTTNIFQLGRSIAQSNQIDLSGSWDKGVYSHFTFNDEGCTAGYSGEVKTSEKSQINITQTGNKLIFATIENTYKSNDRSGSFKLQRSGSVTGNKVQIEMKGITDLGGTVTLTYTGNVSNNGNTIKGKRVCKYSEGSATGEDDFTWQKVSICGNSVLNGSQNLTNAQNNAIKVVNKFRLNKKPGKWQIAREDVSKRLEKLVKYPCLVDQGQLNACGPAAFLYIWFKRDPEEAVRYATMLFDNGTSAVGGIAIRPRKELVEYNGEKKNPAAADWMMMSALRDSENRFIKFRGERDSENIISFIMDKISGITSPSEMKRWLEATGLYKNVVDKTGYRSNIKDSWETQNLDDAKSLLTSTSNRDVIILIDSVMLGHGLMPFPSHYIVLTSSINEEEDKVKFNYWTWGDQPSEWNDLKEKFLANYYGAIIAEK
ncbi:hypothetical protein [Tolypothrix sp. VBCCA 56010]|uniref:hypothetical protein n=1 Tax=Tolypothrix sp. VBCCA 56010 TaxID=3137731 RepID=UPI003D7D09AF